MWYKTSDEAKLITPTLLLFPDRIRKNIQTMIELAGDARRLRPHVKTHKMAPVINMQQEAGISKFKCATLSEANLLLNEGVEDVLIAMPLVGAVQDRFISMVKEHPATKLSLLVDDIGQLILLNNKAKKTNINISFFLDIDVGMHRTGISAKPARKIIDALPDLPNVNFKGLHVYDGHIRNTNFEQRKRRSDEAFKDVELLIDYIKTKNIEIAELICGGSPSFPIHAQYSERVLSPGTALIWDQGYGTILPDIPFIHAGVILTRIISKPGDDLICIDLGHKAIASEMTHPRIHLFGIDNYEVKSHSEEHLVLEIRDPEKYEIGQVIYGIPYHICPTVALHEQVAVIENGKLTEFWNVEARKRIYEV